VDDPKTARAIIQQITDATNRFGLPPLEAALAGNVATLRPAQRSGQR